VAATVAVEEEEVAGEFGISTVEELETLVVAARW